MPTRGLSSVAASPAIRLPREAPAPRPGPPVPIKDVGDFRVNMHLVNSQPKDV
jgi:hypothetical protein